MLTRSAKYIYHALRTPTAHRLGFLDSGFGIEQRYQQHRKAWQPHLDRCFTEQSAWCKAIKERTQANTPRSIAVLGAGRLYDLNISALGTTFTEIHLFDADPSAARIWRTMKKRLTDKIELREHLGDLTGVLESWRATLHRRLGELARENRISSNAWDKALQIVREIPLASCNPTSGELPPSTFCNTHSVDAILSLNILSQLPITWQNIVSHALERMFSPRWTKEHEEQWLAAYLTGAELLIRQHLRDLTTGKIADTLLITDIEYQTDYEGTSEHVAALGHIVLDSKTIGTLCPNGVLTSNTQWIWKLKPATRIEPTALTHHVTAFTLQVSNAIVGDNFGFRS